MDAHYRRWRRKYSNNIVGVHVGAKTRNGRRGTELSIVFHVVLKHGESKRHQIPPHFDIQLPGRKKPTRIPTDVIETGHTQLQSVVNGDPVLQASLKERGTLSFLAVRDGNLYFASNAHVLAAAYLRTGHYRFRSTPPYTDVGIYSENGWVFGELDEMIFGGLDIALARIPSNTHYSIEHPILGRVEAPIMNLGPALFNKHIRMFGGMTGLHTGRIAELNVRRAFGNVWLTGLITIDPGPEGLTEYGDSGGPVLLANGRFLGIHVGTSGRQLLVSPIALIIEALQINILHAR